MVSPGQVVEHLAQRRWKQGPVPQAIEALEAHLQAIDLGQVLHPLRLTTRSAMAMAMTYQRTACVKKSFPPE